ncbi:hypothetical protein J3F84DRAFT_384237 [Trichoderma pleuroticola]
MSDASEMLPWSINAINTHTEPSKGRISRAMPESLALRRLTRAPSRFIPHTQVLPAR